ncbi:MAG TPA: AraC family transcriptional regulator [Capsulimonadaceae bacterium]|jgi:AraC-like DNA-binding protein
MVKGFPPDISAPSKAIAAALNDLPIRVLWAQRDELEAGDWNHSRLANDFWRLYQNDADSATIRLPDSALPLERGAVYIIPPGLDMASENIGPICQFFVHFDIEEIPPIILRELFPGPVKITGSRLYNDCVAEMSAGFHRMGFPNIAAQCAVKGIVYQGVGHALAATPDDVFQRCWSRMSSLKPLLPALEAIQDNAAAAPGNAHLAALCHLSEDHFIKTFRDAIGSPPAHYILKRRIATAAQRLLFTDDSIERIADECGFTDRFYFSRVFSRETGVPPAAYRRGPRA